MNKYLFVIDTDGNCITSLLDGLHGNGEKELTARAKKEFPDAQYVYSDEDMQQEFLSGKIYIGGNMQDAPVVEYVPTMEEIKKQYSDKLGSIMNTKAQEYGYDSILTAVTYADSAIDKFAKEGNAFKEWRDNVYATGYAYLAEIEAGKKAIPATDEEFIALIPIFTLEA